jgi:hypothetical protein
VAETTAKRLLRCRFRRNDKPKGQVHQRWCWIISRNKYFSRFEYHMCYGLHQFVAYLLTLQRIHYIHEKIKEEETKNDTKEWEDENEHCIKQRERNGLWDRVVWLVGSMVSEEHTVSIFCTDDGGSIFLRTVGTNLTHYTVSQLTRQNALLLL